MEGRLNAINDPAPVQTATDELAKLVRKLRWIGLDDEAKCLQQALGAAPRETRASVLNWPGSTD
jgi:hypothetical protein